MKLLLPLLLSLVASVASMAGVDFSGFDATSKAGQKLLMSSRQLEDNFEEGFVARHSIMFDGCHNSTSWSDEGYSIVPLIRYRLCPTKYVHSNRCWSKQVGEYLVQMPTFVDAYMEYQMERKRQNCENLREACGCDGEDDCTCYNTYNGVSWSDCEDEEEEEERYGECQELNVENDDDGNRRLNDNGGYYMGPYCGPGGFNVFLTIYIDQYCAYPMPNANAYYQQLSGGKSMPYQYGDSNGMIQKGKWISCAEQDEDEDGNNNNNNDEEDDDRVIEMCEEAYEGAARCEANMTSLTYPDTSACTYIANMKAQGNVMYQLSNQLSAETASVFVVVGALVAMAAMWAFVTIKEKRANNKASTRTAPLVEVELAA